MSRHMAEVPDIKLIRTDTTLDIYYLCYTLDIHFITITKANNSLLKDMAISKM